MRFLRTLQKNHEERPIELDESLGSAPAPVHERVANAAAGLLSIPELRIGAPSTEHQRQAEPAPLITGTGSIQVLEQAPAGRPTSDLLDLAEVVLDETHVNPRVVSITQPRSPYCEEYRNLRTQIIHRSRKKNLQAVVISSVGPEEGKSVTALNLSWLFAQADGVRALVVDSDLRRPSLAGYLGLEPGSGLSEVLAGEARLVDSIIKIQPAGLYMLPGGEARSDVAELISGRRFSEILNEARAHFDFIIIDAPPLAIFTDASLLINQADAALLVVQANRTKFKDVDRILDSLPRERMLGVVLNQSETALMDESYYRYGMYDRNQPFGVLDG